MQALVKNNSGVKINDINEKELNQNEVLIDTKFVGISPLDNLVSKGFIQPKTLILGGEAFGIVKKSNSEKFSVGDYVITIPKHNELHLGFNIDGVIGTEIILKDYFLNNINNLDCNPLLLLNLLSVSKSLSALSFIKDKILNVGIYGDNIDAYICKLVLNSFNIDCHLIDLKEDIKYDFIINYAFSNNLNALISKLNKNGKLLIKSEHLGSVQTNFNFIIEHQLSIITIPNVPVEDGLSWIIDNKNLLEQVVKEPYELKNWHDAFLNTSFDYKVKNYIKF